MLLGVSVTSLTTAACWRLDGPGGHPRGDSDSPRGDWGDYQQEAASANSKEFACPGDLD